MGQTYYAQSDKPVATMTVRQLVEKLVALPDQDAAIIFKSPLYGCFGSHTAYSLDTVSEVELAAESTNYGRQEHYDEDTDTVPYGEEDYIEHKPAWKGVVIE